jgi:hypothetical protein
MTVPVKYSSAAASRLTRLTESLVDLRERVRTAVAEELGRAIAETVRDLVTLAMNQRMPTPESYRSRTSRYESRDGWSDSSDDWDDFDAGRARPSDYAAHETHHPRSGVSALAVEPSRAAAIALGVTVVRWWLRRNGTVFGSVSAGLAVGIVALSGGTLTQVGLSIVKAISDLLDVSDALNVKSTERT